MLIFTSKHFLMKHDPIQFVILNEYLRICLKIFHNYFKRYKFWKYFSTVNNVYIFSLLFPVTCTVSVRQDWMIAIGDLTRKIMAETTFTVCLLLLLKYLSNKLYVNIN